MTNTRFEEISNKLLQSNKDGKDFRTGAKIQISEIGATLDELREVGLAYGLYLHHCSHCDGWYFHWEE